MCFRCGDKKGREVTSCKCKCSELNKGNTQNVVIKGPGALLGNLAPSYKFEKVTIASCGECKHRIMLSSDPGFAWAPAPLSAAQRKKEWKEWKKEEKASEPALKRELLKEFIESGGKELSKAEIEVLKKMKNNSQATGVNKEILTKLVDNGYIERKGLISKEYIISPKGNDILRWVLYKP